MRRLMAVVFTFVAIFGAGWLSLRRPDIPFDTLETAYASPASRYLVTGEAEKIHYRDQGNPDGDVLVMVHGFSASLHTWEPWVRELGEEYRIITLDLPGHGLTRGFETEDYDAQGFGEAISHVVDALDVDSFTLIGSSMGGYASWNYALSRPAQVDRLVLVASAGWPPSEDEQEDTPFVFRALDNGLVRAVVKDLDNSAMIRSGLEASFADQEMVTEDMIQRYSALNRAPGHRDAILHIISSRDDRNFATPRALQTLTMPTLVMHGTLDNLVPFSHGESFAAVIPGAELVAYDGVGHIPQEEIARRSATDLDAWLDGLDVEAQREVSEDEVLTEGAQ
ncbi:MAG: alpha/beta fold hydrolase [Pseudomonadota bacterium]